MTTVAGKSKFANQNTSGKGRKQTSAPFRDSFLSSGNSVKQQKHTEQTYLLYSILSPKGKVKNIFPKKPL